MEDWVDHLESLVDLLADLGTSQDNLARDEDQENDLWLDHAVDQSWEQLWLVGAEVVVLGCETLQADWELDIARANDVLDLEVRELSVEAELLDDTGVLARGELGVVLGLGTSDNHLAGGEDQGSSFWLANAHDNSSETLVRLAKIRVTSEPRVSRYLWVVLGVSRVESDRLEIQAAIQVDRGNDVSFRQDKPREY